VTPQRWRLLLGAHVALAVAGLGLLPTIMWVDVHAFWAKWHGLSLHHLPYRDFLWEFPPATAVLVAPARLLQVNGFAGYFAVVSALASWGGLRLVCRLRPDRERAVVTSWLVAGGPLFLIAWYRFDAMAVLLTCLALVAYHEGRRGSAIVAAGFSLRLWPALLLVVPAVRRQSAEVVRSVVAILGVVVVWFWFSPSGFRDFLRYRKGAGYQVESVLGSLGLALGRVPTFVSGAWVVSLGRLDRLDPVLTVAWLVLVAASARRLSRTGGDPVRLAGALVLALLVTSRIVSPQYLVWPLPFVTLAAVDGDRRLLGVYATSSLLTVAEIWHYDLASPVVAWVIVVRNVLLVWCTVHELRVALRPKHAFDRAGAGPVGSPRWPTRSSSAAPASTT